MAKELAYNEGENYKKSQVKLVKCSGCGANMVFNPEIQKLYCPHCETEKEIDKSQTATEIDFLFGVSQDDKWGQDETVVFSCENCGAKVVLQKDETADHCPFCGTAHVKPTEELAGLKPNAIVPFQFSLNKAIEYSKTWAKKKFFAPKSFKKNLQAQNLSGIYSPSFTFDTYTSSVYEGRVGVTKTRTVGSGKNRRVETYTVWRHISGVYYDNFDDLVISAGSRTDDNVVRKILPFNTNASVKYQENFLLGYSAYHYDYSIDDCWEKAKRQTDRIIENRILSQHPHDKVAYLNVSTKHEKVTFKYIMLPIYIGNFSYKKKVYNFHVNGETGKVYGKTPVSWIKVLLAVVLGIAFVAGIGALFFYLGL